MNLSSVEVEFRRADPCATIRDGKSEIGAMDLRLTPELERRVAETVASGRYASADAVVEESLRLFFEADDRRAERRDRMNADIRLGLDQLDRGEGLDGERSRQDMSRRFATGG